jgi:tetratricopeptide (TPR) repeat protein
VKQQDVVALYRWFDELCSSHEPADVEQILRGRIGSESDGATVSQLTFLLAEALSQQDKYEDAEDVYRLLSAKYPTDPYPLLRIAEQRLYYQDDLPSALSACDEAIELATKRGPWRRQALGAELVSRSGSNGTLL